jgi:hypothetical protein
MPEAASPNLSTGIASSYEYKAIFTMFSFLQDDAAYLFETTLFPIAAAY